MIQRGLISILCVVSLIRCYPQTSFVTTFETTANETTGWFMQNSINEYIGIISITPYGSTVRSNYLYKFGELGDTLLSRRFQNGDTIMRLHDFIQSNTDPIRYLVSGQGIFEDTSSYKLYNYFSEIDENFNTIWERYFKLLPADITTLNEYRQNLLMTKDSGYVFATNYDNPGDHRLILFRLSNQGDSLHYRSFAGDSAGHVLMDLSYNYDSTAYLLNIFRSHPVPFWGESQLITCDLEFQQIKVDYYPRWFRDGATTKILPDNSLVTGGLYENLEPPAYSNFTVYKYDTEFNLLNSCSVSDPNFGIRKDRGRNSLDYHYPNSIFVAGTFDYDIGVWVQHPSWIVIGKMDENLDLLVEKYIGGDAYYHYWTITATSDGGALITTTRYDYLTQNQEHDAYIIKLDSLELSVGTQEYSSLVQDVLVYPNPSSHFVNIRYPKLETRNSIFIYDMFGRLMDEIAVPAGHVESRVDVSEYNNGIYVAVLRNEEMMLGRVKFEVRH